MYGNWRKTSSYQNHIDHRMVDRNGTIEDVDFGSAVELANLNEIGLRISFNFCL